LTVGAEEFRLEGYYAPPGGELGLVLDRALLGIAARGTARWFLERVTEALGDGAPAPERAARQAAARSRTPDRPTLPNIGRVSGSPQGD
jgi:hypothetical protein